MFKKIEQVEAKLEGFLVLNGGYSGVASFKLDLLQLKLMAAEQSKAFQEIKEQNYSLKEMVSNNKSELQMVLNTFKEEAKTSNDWIQKEILLMKMAIAEVRMNSDICTSAQEMNYLLSLFDKTPTFILLYRGSVDGWYFADFHRCCDNKGPTLTLIKTDKNLKIGGYTSQSWVPYNVEWSDSESFIFSISSQSVFRVKSHLNSISSSEDSGPKFGSDALTVRGQPFNWKNNCTSCPGESNYMIDQDGSGNNVLTKAKGEFTATEIEIYQVII
jgi:phosphotransferase system IIB component